ncbi:hypothetical protein F4821DRAFT_81691 [Hypoxylon rubiginosum]|uniref:Uncharacterized protein n=1 Tax=Hypoxylon rubiginosum TaxID=110542 RepID=A0ACC0D7L2_9PEZI|nr:hypothetical protein F4821DRAFT_81691 [Hypoxylon rubiginosum]
MGNLRTYLSEALVAISLACSISAAANVTVLPLGSGCASFPGYDNTTGIAGPLHVAVDSTGGEFDGFQFVPQFSTAVGGGAWGFMVIRPVANGTAAPEPSPMQCANDTLQAYLDMGFVGVRWQNLIAAGTPAESVFGFGLPDLPDPNYHLETYQHVVDGEIQPDAYLGAVNITTWGFNYQNFTETGEYYFARLLDHNSNNLATGEPLNPGEFTGYIKVTAA